MTIIAESSGRREFHQACAESVRRSQEDARLLKKRIDTLLAGLAGVSAESTDDPAERNETGAPSGRTGEARIFLEAERTEVTGITDELTGLLEQQLTALDWFNVVLFGRTGTGKSSLVEALAHGDGARVSTYGESDWTKDVTPATWHGCRVYDTPGVGGWETNVPPEQLERARLAVACADVVLLCFDSQNQRATEFKTVSAWIGEYDKAAIAVLNVRNEKWGIADLMPEPAARRACSVQVAQHVQHLRAELATIGLHRAPVIAVHARNAMFACAREPYRGPAQATRSARLSRLGAKGLYRCSNVPVLERLLMTVIRQSATPLRLGSVSRLVAGAAQEARRRTAEFVSKAEAMAAVHEKGIARALDIIGLPAPAAGEEDYAGFLDSLAALEERRDCVFQIPFPTRAKRYATDLITAKLASLEADAQARADDFIEKAMRERRPPKPGAFESAVFSQPDIDAAIEAAVSQFRDYLARHFELIARDMRSDLDRLATDQVRLRPSAGSVLKTIGMASSIGGIGAGTAGVAVAGVIAASNPVGWLALAIAVGWAMEGFGASWRRRGVGRWEQALGEARALGREAVRETFGQLGEILAAEFDGLGRQALIDNLAEPVAQALVLRRLARAGVTRTDLLGQFRDQVAASAHAPQDLLIDAVRECESSQSIHDAAGRRRLWLGESWLGDHDADPSGARVVSPAARPEVRDEVGRFAATQGLAPQPGSGRGWLETVSRELAGMPDVDPLIAELGRLVSDGHPRIVICGDYNSGKSSLIARLQREARRDGPENLVISAAPADPVITEHHWEGFTLVDTPGFQADRDVAAEETIMEIASAAVVLILFTPGLALGDRTDLVRTLAGDPARRLAGKSGNALLVINRADELGADPETGDEFALLCAHKCAQLRESLAIPGYDPPPAHVVCVAADPYGAGQAEAWDGMAELAQALKVARGQFLKNASDVTILGGGLARIGALIRRLTQELSPLSQRAYELRVLEQDLRALLSEAAELDAERRAVLRREVTGLIEGLISGTLAARNDDQRHALVRRLENLPEDTQFRRIVAAWSGNSKRKVAALEQAIGQRIARRLGDRELMSAVPELNQAADARVLGSAKTKKVIGSGIARAGGALQKLEPFTVGATATTRLARVVRIGGPALNLASAGHSAWSLVSEQRAGAARARERAETIRALQRQGVEWADELGDHDSALTRLVMQIELLREALAGVAEETQVATTAAIQLDDRIGRCERLARQAAELLGMDTKGTP
jgi:predicted GTPase